METVKLIITHSEKDEFVNSANTSGKEMGIRIVSEKRNGNLWEFVVSYEGAGGLYHLGYIVQLRLGAKERGLA